MKKAIFLVLTYLSCCLALFAQSPTVAAIGNIDGTVDSKVGISGANFSLSTTNMSVWFGGSKATVLQATDNFLEVSVPAGTTTSSISVTNTLTGLTGHSSDIFNLNYSGSSGNIDYASQEVVRFDSFEEIFDLTICDFDLDGLNDIAASKIGDLAGDIVVFQNTSTGNTINFSLLNKISNPEFDIKNPTSNITCGDVDGDGKLDLIATRAGATANQIYVWRNISTPGNIQFANQKSYFITAGEIAKAIKIKDLDGNGKPEMVISNNEENTVLIFENTSTKGNVNFTFTPISITVPGSTSTNGLDVEDLNGDGKAEIITNPLFEPNVYILENQSTTGNFIFSAPITLSLVGNLNSLVVGDLNRDGKSDIAVTKTQESKIAFFVNNSTSDISFENAVEFDTGDRPWGLDLGDINGDGLLDVFTTSINSNEATFLRNKTTGGVLDFEPQVVAQNFNTRNVKIGDLSGDGKPDFGVTGFDFVSDEYRLITIRITHCVVPTVLDAPASICSGQTIRLNATSGLFIDYVWEKDGVEVKNSTDPFLDITLPGTYTVAAVSEGGSCSEISEDFVIALGTGGIPPDITSTVSNDGPVCPGDDLTLSIQTVAGATYSWTGPNDFTSTDQNPVVTNVTAAMAGEYIATVFLGDCQSVPPGTTLVEVIVPPDFSIQASGDTRFCEGNSVDLSINSEPGFTYQWLKDNVDIPGATVTTYSATEAGDYTVEVSSATINCNIDSDLITVETFAPPEALFSLSGAQCANNDILFTDESNILTEFVVAYSWDFGDGTVSTLADPTHAFATAGDYTVQLTVSYGGQNCEDTETTVITIAEPTPFTITVTGDNPFCEGGSADLSVQGSFDSYLWSTGETTDQITVTSTDTYSVTVTNSAGCPSTDQIDISVFATPIIIITPDSVVLQQGDTAQLVASGASTYVWSPGESLSDSTIANPIAAPLATSVYTVTGTDSNGCIGEGSALVTIETGGSELPVTAPKLFSPNGDTIDDEWVIANIENFPQCQLVIFGRSGINVLEASPYNNDWDGNLNGEPLPEGAYYYVISCPDGRSKTGSVSIIR